MINQIKKKKKIINGKKTKNKSIKNCEEMKRNEEKRK